MANNIPIRDGNGQLKSMQTTESGAVHTPHNILDTGSIVGLEPRTTGGLSIHRTLDANATGVNVKGSAGMVYGIHVFNSAGATRYLKLYNKATTPTVGTDTPVLTIPIAAGAARDIPCPTGIVFTLGIGVGATTALADNSTTAPAANDVILDLLYK